MQGNQTRARIDLEEVMIGIETVQDYIVDQKDISLQCAISGNDYGAFLGTEMTLHLA